MGPLKGKFLVGFLLFLLLGTKAHGAQLNLIYGSSGNDGAGEPLRTSLAKIQTNFNTLFTNGPGNVAGKVWLVDASYGNDTIATNGFYASRTLTNAKALAAYGDLIQVRPGNYTNNNLMKAGVQWDFLPGAKVFWTVPTNTDAGYGIFDDRAPGAAGTNLVTGWGEFIYRDSNPSCINAQGVMMVTNPISEVRIAGNALRFGSPSAALCGVNVKNCKYVNIRFETVRDTFELWSNLDPDLPEFTVGSAATGIYWENGEMHCQVKDLVTYGGYALWTRDPGGATNSFYYQGDLIAASNWVALYASAGTVSSAGNLRTWVVAEEIYSPAIGVSVLGNVKVYVTAQKVSGGASGTAVDASGELWLTTQKISSGSQWINKASTTAGTRQPKADIFAMEYENLGNVGNVVPAIRNTSTNELILHGGTMRGGTNFESLVKLAGGPIRIMNAVIDASDGATTNAPVIVLTNGLTLINTRILASSLATLSIHATQAVVVDFQNCFVNKAINPLITQSNGWLQVSNTWTGAGNVAVAGSVSVYRGPAVVGGINTNGVATMSVSNSALVYPAQYTVFVQSASGLTDTNNGTTELTLLGTGSYGSLTLPDGFWRAGTVLEGEWDGQFWTPGAGTMNTYFQVKLGSTMVADLFVAPITTQSGRPTKYGFRLTCRTSGASGVIDATGFVQLGSTWSGFTNRLTTLDLRPAMAVDFTSTNQVSSQSYVTHNGIIKVTPGP